MQTRVISVICFFGGWAGMALFAFEIPSHIVNALTWLRWLRAIPEPTVLLVSIGMLVTGPLVWTSGWWWARVSQWTKRMMSHQETKEPSADAIELSPLTVPTADPAQVEKFKGLESLITRHREANRPIRDLIMASLWSPMDTLAFRADREILVAHLGALKVPHPPDDASRKIWFRYLVHLEASCQTGNLQEARSIHEEDDTKQPTTDV